VLPLIMVAPNGARRTKSDHPALPMTVAETVAAAKACYEAGAGALHAHVRDDAGHHVLDAVLYRQLLSQMKAAAPQMLVQITTEAVGRYSPSEQRHLVQEVRPQAVSIALKEMIPDAETAEAASFYAWAQDEGIAVQHILYSPDDVARFLALSSEGVVPDGPQQVLFVLGRYSQNQQSAPEDLDPFLQAMETGSAGKTPDWAVCAFGERETECLAYAVSKGGKARIGFENGLWNRDGRLARDNAHRVRDLTSALAHAPA